jgi:energy-coupling factor transport system permease protein
MIPLLAADSERLAEAQRTRPAGALTGPRARVALLGAVVGGSLDRAMDVAATLELRGFAAGRLEIARSSIGHPRPHRSQMARPWSRHDFAFACSTFAILALGILGRLDSAASFDAYPLVHMPVTAATGALCIALIAAILLPFADRRGIDP